MPSQRFKPLFRALDKIAQTLQLILNELRNMRANR